MIMFEQKSETVLQLFNRCFSFEIAKVVVRYANVQTNYFHMHHTIGQSDGKVEQFEVVTRDTGVKAHWMRWDKEDKKATLQCVLTASWIPVIIIFLIKGYRISVHIDFQIRTPTN
jgi:hypothetical protein